jgi:hypothetical protein
VPYRRLHGHDEVAARSSAEIGRHHRADRLRRRTGEPRSRGAEQSRGLPFLQALHVAKRLFGADRHCSAWMSLHLLRGSNLPEHP